jgi:N-acetylglucosaminyldiphosphoundecaprenol N-acetyl-beta-D-mannosaminyltransferase
VTSYANFAGVRVDALTTRDLVDTVDGWLAAKRPRARYIACMNAYCVASALRDPALRAIYGSADLAVPDGMPFVRWIRRFVQHDCDLLDGAHVIHALAARAQETGARFYLYGGTPEACTGTQRYLEEHYPRLVIAGACSPPFRPLTADEDRAVCDEINALAPDIILVGLGTPKQDHWIAAHRDRIPGTVMIAVGAAYDFFSGRVPMAPRAVQEAGFAWLYRLLGPDRKRLWRRYTIDHGYFLWHFARQLVGIERPAVEPRPR